MITVKRNFAVCIENPKFNTGRVKKTCLVCSDSHTVMREAVQPLLRFPFRYRRVSQEIRGDPTMSGEVTLETWCVSISLYSHFMLIASSKLGTRLRYNGHSLRPVRLSEATPRILLIHKQRVIEYATHPLSGDIESMESAFKH